MEKNITKHCTYANVCRECSLFIIDQHLDNAANIWWNETCSNYMMQGYRPVTAVKIGITNEILLYNQTRCCKGQRTLFFTATNTVTTAMSRRETSFLPQKTATSAVPPLTSFGPPRIPSTEPGYNATSALIIGLVCAVLLCVLCFCACKYRRYRKTKLAMEKKNQIQPPCEYLYPVVEEFQGIEAVDNTISNYLVIEARNDSNLTTYTTLLPTSVIDQPSSEYENIANLPNIEDDRKEIQMA
ncbi:uncharacterized protein LOC144626183 isoform X1 [Crassostrea virginica]